MATDFAKRSKKRASATPLDHEPAKAKIPGWLYLVVGLLIGMMISYADTIKTFFQSEPTEVVANQKSSQPTSAKTRYQAVPTEELEKDDFSFHNVLENKVVKVPTNPEQNSPAKAKTTQQFIMQCGSFRKLESADTLKAQIAMTGFESTIRATDEQDGHKWFRVILGPYQSKRDAEADRHQLERNNINRCRIW
jgi:cell division protein FtsN